MDRISSVPNSGNSLIDALVWGARWGNTSTPTTITVGYRTDAGSAMPTAAEIATMRKVVADYAAVINVNFVWKGQSNAAETDISFCVQTYTSGYLGYADIPGGHTIAGNPHTDVTVWRSNYSSTLQPGSYDYVTFAHEFGHALGLAHPHDTAGAWNDKSLKFPGINISRDYGDYGLNQGIFTTMSYNDGWASRDLQPLTQNQGYQSTPMAIDIMALQHIYGARQIYASSNTVYDLGAAVYSSIWDTGGSDTVRYSGSSACVIDLRAATGRVAYGGGGYVSHVKDVAGGFTIANGVTLENAIGGNGNDVLFGNATNNVLTGGLGRDTMYGGAGADTFVFRRITDSAATVNSADVIARFEVGIDKINLRYIDASSSAALDQAFTFIASSAFTAPGQMQFSHVNTTTYIHLNTDADAAADSIIRLTGIHMLTSTDFIL